MRELAVLVSLMATVVGVGCGPDGAQPETDDVDGAGYDGQVDVREGPSAPLTIKGKIVFFQGPSGVGAAIQPDGSDDVLEVGATLVDEELRLEIPWESGTIVGTGPMTGDFVDPVTVLEGDLLGPQDGDSGDWIFTDPGPFLGYVCFAACSYAGGSDAECNKECGFSS